MTQKDTKVGPRAIAIVGPYQSGKTSLLERILFTTGDLNRKSVSGGARVFGDTSPEAKNQSMGIDLNVATTEFMGDRLYFLDCPGSLEYIQESHNVLQGVDAAIVVVEPDPTKVQGIAPLLNTLDKKNIPHMIFINKIDKATGSVDQLIENLNHISDHPIILRHLPIIKAEHITGYVDLASERAYIYQPGQQSRMVKLDDIESQDKDHVDQARYSMLETLADFDDHLMEELLEDIEPPKAEIFEDISTDTASNLVIPAFLGSATGEGGIFRLLKAIRHEVPGIEATCKRREINRNGELIGQVLKTYHTNHGGKRSLVRIFSGQMEDGEIIKGQRVAGIMEISGEDGTRKERTSAGDLVTLGRLDDLKTTDTICVKAIKDLDRPEVLPSVYEVALEINNPNDEVRLMGSLHKICDEDPSITYEQNKETKELVLKGQGEVQLRIAVERLKQKFNLSITTKEPMVPYKETICRSAKQHTRFKKQSGGHGQYGDVVLEVRPQERGKGFDFEETIHGGSIPRQYIPSVEHGVRDYLIRGPLGFPVVDVAVKLTDGKFHAVDSSDMAFQIAGRMAMSEAMPDCKPVLLEPIMQVTIMVPNIYTNKVTGMISQRRGQILGYDTRQGWPEWDSIESLMPKSVMHDLIVELRSMTSGSGTYISNFDHMQELTGKLADKVLEQHA